MGKKSLNIVLFLIVLPCIAFAQTGVISDATIIPPDYDTFQVPEEVGGTYVDPAFGTVVQRITNCSRFDQDLLGGYFGNSEICYFNTDGSYFISAENEIIDGKNLITTFLYNGITGTRIKMLGLYNGAFRPERMRWALADKYKKNGEYVNFDPVYCYYTFEGNEVRLYDVRDLNNYVVIHAFTEYTDIGMAGDEGDLSDDGRYWVLDGDAHEMFVYDLIDDIKYPVSTFDLMNLGSKGDNVGVDYAAISTSGEYVVVAWGTAAALGEQFHGIEVYDKNWNYLRQLHPGIIHWEIGRDSFGDEVIYTAATFEFKEYFASAGAVPGDIISIRLSDGNIRLLKHIPKWTHLVMTACNSVSNSPYLYVSMMNRSEDPEALWFPFWGEIIEIPTNGSGEVRRLVHTRSREIAGRIEKYYQPDAVINRQGTKILYRSTYNNTVGDVYMFDVGNRNENDSVPPLEPSNIQGTSLINSIQLSWTAPAQASDGDLASFYKVYRNGSLIAETFNVHYTDQDLNEAQTYSYQIYSVDNVGNVSVESCSGDFQTLSDTEPPTLLSVSLQSRTQIRLLFSEPVDQTTTDDVNNYQINNGLSVLSAVLQPDSMSVLLTTQTIELGVLYELGLENIRDVSANSNVIAAGTVTEFRFLSDFYEDFENSSTENWEFRTPQRWQIGQFDGNSALYITTSEYENPGDYLLGEYAILYGDLVLTNQFKVSYNAKILDDIFSNQHADHVFIFSFTDSLNYEYLQFHTYDVAINKIVNGVRIYLEKFPYEFNLDQELHLSAIFENDSLYVLQNDLPVLTKYYPIHTAGRVGFGSFNDAGWFDNINLENIGEIDLSVPEPPTSLYSSGGTINSLILQWTAPIQPELFYRIYRDDVLIGESTDPVFTDTGLETIKTYHYKVYSVNYSGVQSEVAASGSFATSSDVEAPEITAMHINSRTEIHLEFSEPVEQNSAENTSNYVIDNQINVLQATLSDDSLTVVLQTEPIDLGEEYTLTVNNVTDVSANRNAIESNTIIPFGLYVDFFDDFETTVAENWTFYTDSRWSLTADNGSQTLFLNTTDFESPADKLLGEAALLNESVFSSPYFVLSCKAKSAENLLENQNADYAIVFGYQDSLNYHYLQFHMNDVSIHTIENGIRTYLIKHPHYLELDQYHQISVTLKKDSLSVNIDEQSIFSQEFVNNFGNQIGLGSFNDAAYFDNLSLQTYIENDKTPPAKPTGLYIILAN